MRLAAATDTHIAIDEEFARRELSIANGITTVIGED
jgi:hypothetical protein